MLVVRGDIAVTDLTDDVTMIGKDAVACGAFSDVWKGKWWDRSRRKGKDCGDQIFTASDGAEREGEAVEEVGSRSTDLASSMP